MSAAANDLLQAAKAFYNATIGDVSVVVRTASPEKRDAVVAAAERLRIALLDAKESAVEPQAGTPKEGAAPVPAQPKLIGWRTDDYLMETSDHKTAKSWEVHYNMLPIFEGDTNTKLATQVDSKEAPAEPAGWKRVPVTITEAMHANAVRTLVRCTGNDDWPPRVWAAMLAASPKPSDSGSAPTWKPSVEPQAVPAALTEEQIAEACGWAAEMGCKPLPRELRIARAIERAHGIASTPPEGARE